MHERYRLRFMRLIIMFDLPTETKQDKRIYTHFVKFLKEEGYVRMQYSVYSKLCINNDSLMTFKKHLLLHAPENGDVRTLTISEKQYQSIINVNDTYSLQEKVTTTDRIVIVGGLNDEDNE